MATKFKVWIDSPTAGTNILGNDAYSSDTQRTNGFQPNTVASSIRVNTALRSANLVTAALMDAFLPSSALDESSSMEDVTSALAGVIAGLASPAFTGNPTAPTQSYTDNSTKLATTAFVNAFINGFGFTRIFRTQYTGTGVYGSQDPNTITFYGMGTGFDIIPRLTIVASMSSNYISMFFWDGAALCLQPGNAIGNVGLGATYNYGSASPLTAASLSWYSTDADKQMNTNGVLYRVITFA